jgi:hypothetical protein
LRHCGQWHRKHPGRHDERGSCGQKRFRLDLHFVGPFLLSAVIDGDGATACTLGTRVTAAVGPAPLPDGSFVVVCSGLTAVSPSPGVGDSR